MAIGGEIESITVGGKTFKVNNDDRKLGNMRFEVGERGEFVTDISFAEFEEQVRKSLAKEFGIDVDQIRVTSLDKSNYEQLEDRNKELEKVILDERKRSLGLRKMFRKKKNELSESLSRLEIARRFMNIFLMDGRDEYKPEAFAQLVKVLRDK